ncbi:MAG: hypothetical protein COU85_01380 [Candidatus Portnoybacteria bacterium CG10_big_fil_rev_8_21_14_0_10_44_7]|uniref:Cation-transporting P-type ATPase N-terminal domain-containing protein n=1 Tax=Candidatus Portnoybacteria bacterium CG10_big_fil_rev_8_21_14_0_10_44_7 TaxID=1974816 RepID=A0A2M8KIY5_9BACT|nr:MAG: hypothetical protein COU85_01380 [Candidatus Portnoybacteria bacterium CG10_big_fil_rev_8_21_14_0_10_44_7]
MPSWQRGLDEAESRRRLEKYGPNRLETTSQDFWLKIFLRQFKNPLVYILLVAGLVTLFLADWTDTVIIFFTLLLNALIGFYQERKMAADLQALNRALPQKATVWRGGIEKEIEASKIVPGDIISFKLGDRVPADARLFDAHYLKTNEAALTGEWLGQLKQTAPLASFGLALGDQKNMVFMGTFVEEGKGRALVVGTGGTTQIGQIVGYVRGVKKEKTMLEKRLARLSRFLGLFIGLVSLAIIFFGVLAGKNFFEMFLTGVAVAVSAIPEGLPVAITVILVVGAKKILKKHGLVRRLRSVETLGSTTIICTDKTGTLTEGKMNVVRLLTGAREILHDGYKFSLPENQNSNAAHLTLLKIITLANEAAVENPQDELAKLKIHGRATDKALLLAGLQAGLRKEELVAQYVKIDELPFDAARKYYLGLYHTDHHNVLFSVGAPEILLEKCVEIDLDGKIKKLDEQKRAEIQTAIARLGRQGLHVLGVAKKDFLQREVKKITGTLDKLQFRLVFVGLVGLKDPLRPGVKENIRQAQQAGLKLTLVTGDHLDTALAIARELDLTPDGAKEFLTGKQISLLDAEKLKATVRQVKIFARVDPKDKLRIVQALQENGEVVAMTGDGINDTPALKRADIGLALGSGTDAAREVADLVMLDDSFAVIISAIKQGRVILDNIKKTLAYLLADSFSEIILIVGSIVAGLPLPILPAQILWVNLIDDALPSMSLVFEKAEGDVMRRRPQGRKTRIFDAEIKFFVFVIGVVTNLLLFALFWWYFRQNYDLEHIRTIIFAALGLDSLIYVFACKSLRQNIWHIRLFNNKHLLVAVGFGLLMLLAAIYLPFLQTLLKTQPLYGFDWGVVAILSLLDLLFIELGKWLFIWLKKA